MTAAATTKPKAAATTTKPTTAAAGETADELALRIAGLETERKSLLSHYQTSNKVHPRVFELEHEIATLNDQHAEVQQAEERARPVEQPAGPTLESLPAFLEHVLSLRRMTDQLQVAGANIEQMHALLEAQQAALQDLAAIEVAALLERIKAEGVFHLHIIQP